MAAAHPGAAPYSAHILHFHSFCPEDTAIQTACSLTEHAFTISSVVDATQ